MIEFRLVFYIEVEMYKIYVNLLGICFIWCKDNLYYIWELLVDVYRVIMVWRINWCLIKKRIEKFVIVIVKLRWYMFFELIFIVSVCRCLFS